MFDVFGPDMPLVAKFFIAFAVVLALIALTAWLIRRFGANRLSGASRGRQPRLAVIDAASVDGRRRLVLIRRDNIEHLMMIGGPNDLIIEPNIVRATAARDVVRETQRGAQPADTLARPVALPDAGSWPLQPAPEPVPAPAPPVPTAAPPARPYRSNVPDEPWNAPAPEQQPQRQRQGESLTGMAADFSTRLSADLGMPVNRPAPPMTPPPVRETAPPPAATMAAPPAPPPPAAPLAPPQTDHNLAEMAQRLEAALRRPSTAEMHPPVTDPLAAPLAAPPKAPETRVEPRIEPRLEPRPTPPRETLRPAPEVKPEPAPAPAAKGAFDSLEQEMANLLGRPSGKT